MIKCPYCGKEFEVQVMMGSAGPVGPKPKWYHSTIWVIILLLCAGPFVLHIVWFNPNYKRETKIIITVIVIAVSVWGSIWLYGEVKTAWDTAMQQLNSGKF